MTDRKIEIDSRKLAEIRERAGLTPKEFAQRVNKSKTCISNYENGWSNPPANVLLAYLIFGSASAYEILQESSK